VSPAEPIEIPFGLWTRSGTNEPCVRWGPDPVMRMCNFEGERAPHCKVQGCSVVSCAEAAEPVNVPFGTWTQVGPRNHALDGDLHSQ